MQWNVHKINYNYKSFATLNFEKARYHTFVANRVSVKLEESDVSLWHYLETKENPADVASRDLKMKDLLQSKLRIYWTQIPVGGRATPTYLARSTRH